MAFVWSITESGKAVADSEGTQPYYVLKALRDKGPMRRQEVIKAVESAGCRSDGDLGNNVSFHLSELKKAGYVAQQPAPPKRARKPKPPPSRPDYSDLDVHSAVWRAIRDMPPTDGPPEPSAIAEFVTACGLTINEKQARAGMRERRRAQR